MLLPPDQPSHAVTLDGGAEPVVVFRGELDLGAAVTLQDTIDRARRSGRPLTIDLSGATFMDSSGLNVLLRARLAGGGRLDAVTLRAPSAPVVSTLEMAGIARLFRTIP